MADAAEPESNKRAREPAAEASGDVKKARIATPAEQLQELLGADRFDELADLREGIARRSAAKALADVEAAARMIALLSETRLLVEAQMRKIDALHAEANINGADAQVEKLVAATIERTLPNDAVDGAARSDQRKLLADYLSEARRAGTQFGALDAEAGEVLASLKRSHAGVTYVRHCMK